MSISDSINHAFKTRLFEKQSLSLQVMLMLLVSKKSHPAALSDSLNRIC